MPDVKIKGYSGNELEYQNVPKVYLAAPESTPDNPVLVPFTYGEAIEGVEVEPDFSSGDMQITAPDGYLIRSGVVKKPETLVPENIAKDVEVAGIVGTHEGGSGGGESERPPENKPIRFYDPYGNVIYGYTRKEIQELTALPEGPSLPGVDFHGWTYSLATLKSEKYFADVGPSYKKKTTDTFHLGTYVHVIIVETLKDNETIVLTFFGKSCAMGIDWGDGNKETVSITGSSNTTNTPTHKYVTAGIYVVAISFDETKSGSCTMGYIQSSSCYNMTNSVLSYSSTSYGSTTGVTNLTVISILMASSTLNTGWGQLGIVNLHSEYRLKFVSNWTSSTADNRKFMNCFALKAIAGNASNLKFWSFRGAVSLERLRVAGTVEADSFVACDSLKEVKFANGAISDNTMNSKWAMLMTTTTPPTVSASAPKWGTYPIYVPDEAVETYKAASGWSNAADYIKPLSEYPD